MIIVKMSGGLGNQMFQFAAGLALSIKKKTFLALDLSSYKLNEHHNGFELSTIFRGFVFREATESEIKVLIGPIFNFKFLWMFKLEEKVRKLSKNYISEVDFNFKEDFFDLPDNIFLEGYWQSYLYFYNYSNQIKKVYSFPKFYDHVNISTKKKILSSGNSVSIHFRRGDYVYDSKTNSYHGVCDFKYYKQAINFFVKKKLSLTFFIFSDDIAWVKKNLDLNKINHVYVNHNSGETSFNDMSLMSLCDHNIIANSTFSWWGAWLNSNPKKIVVYPKKWFADKDAVTLCPPDWISF